MANFGSGRKSRSFNRDRSDSDRGSRFGGSRNRGGFRDRDSRHEMHEATCSKCGKSCQVPFRPTGSKPVFCSACFEQSGSNRDSRNSGRYSRESFGSRDSNRQFNRASQSQSGNSSEQLNQINAKLDKIIKILQELEMYDDEEDSEEDSKE